MRQEPERRQGQGDLRVTKHPLGIVAVTVSLLVVSGVLLLLIGCVLTFLLETV